MNLAPSIPATLHADLVARIRNLSRPLAPHPTRTCPILSPLPFIRIVLFDVYGTMLVSGCGDLSIAGDTWDAHRMREALHAAGITCGKATAAHALDTFRETIEAIHAEARSRGVDCPEVDIREVWHTVLKNLVSKENRQSAVTEATVLTVAVEYELRVNPVWPMPALCETIRSLHARGIAMGIVSNAQFYTPLTLEAFSETGWLDGLFDSSLCAWSWQHRVAKPSRDLFAPVLEGARQKNVPTDQVLYVGNDMLNDIWAARQVGFRTAWFAGDARSMRERADDPRIAGITPDVVLTRLDQLTQILSA